MKLVSVYVDNRPNRTSVKKEVNVTAQHFRLADLNMDVYALSDAEFRFVADQDVRRDHPRLTERDREILTVLGPQLRQAENLDRWYNALVVMKRSAESQLGARREDVKKLYGEVAEEKYLERLRRFREWRAGNLRFLNGVEERLAECRRLRAEEFGGKLPAIVEVLHERITGLASLYEHSIAEHKRLTLADGLEPSEADEHLWARLGSDRNPIGRDPIGSAAER